MIVVSLNITASPLRAQIIPPPPIPPQNPKVPPPEPLPSQPLLNPLTPPTQYPQIPFSNQGTIRVKKFVFVGNTAFSTKKLESVTAPYAVGNITFTELQQAVNAVTSLYTSSGYIASGAFISAAQNQQTQLTRGAVITIQVVEGKVAQINVTGSTRLRRYVRSRLRVAVSPVLNQNRLLEGLRLLQANRLIKTISAELTPSSQRGRTVLNVRVAASPTISVQPVLDNDRSPLVGTEERRIQFNNSNLFGLGDALSLTYRNTLGSNAGEASYSIPLNPYDTTLQFDYAIVNSNIIEPPFNRLNIEEVDRSYQVSLRQPLLRTADARSTKEFALGVTASRQESDQRLLGRAYPISPGADNRGRTRISAVRFFQEWNKRSDHDVVVARSEFSLGVGALDATIRRRTPDSRFFLWRGQAAWLRRLNRHNLSLLTRVDLQFSDRPLVSFEQFSLGGVSTVRGYRQYALLTDSGVLGSVELRVPVVANRVNQLLLAPFIDAGSGFNVRGSNPNPSSLVGAGLGVEYQLGERLRVRLDYGIPIINYPTRKRTLQDNGFYFNVSYTLF